MPAIIGAHHTSYSVTNMAQTLAFYRDRLGFEVVAPVYIHGIVIELSARA